jgi:hypothetical protein
VHSREPDVGAAANPFVEIGSAILWRDELAGSQPPRPMIALCPASPRNHR